MFGNSNKKEANKSNTIIPTSSSHALNSIVKGTTIEGDIKSDSDIRIDGTIKGKLTCKAKVIIGPSGMIEGEIKCQSAVVEGQFEGTFNVSGTLSLKESARVKGEITAGKFAVQQGAVISGNVNMGGTQKVANGEIRSSHEAKKVAKTV